MGVANLAVIFSPNMFFMKESAKPEKGDQNKERDLQAVSAGALRFLIENHEKLFTVLPSVIAQMRYQKANTTKGKKAGKVRNTIANGSH